LQRSRISRAIVVVALGWIASATARADLADRLDAVLDTKALRGAKVGAYVSSRADGRMLYARGADLPLVPASNQKVLTAVTALATFGPAHRFSTEVLASATPDPNGAVADLYVRGGGDPALGSAEFWRMASEVRAAGVRRVAGDLVVDDMLFDAVRANPSWGPISSRIYYAPVGALTANYGIIEIEVQPGAAPGEPARVAVDPPLSYFRVDNRTTTSPRDRRSGARVDRMAPKAGDVFGLEMLLVRGTARLGAGPQGEARSVVDPGLYAANLLAWQLESLGIAVEGGVRRARVPAGARPLVVWEGRSLAEIVRVLMKTSSNPVAEMLCKAVAVATGATPGTWNGGVAAMRRQLGLLGVDVGALHLVDGSGLSRQNRVTARVLVDTLQKAGNSFAFGPEFVASLPIAGTDGTLARREHSIEGAVRAKTGSLTGVVALAGYAQLASGGEAIFAVLINDAPAGDVTARAAADRFAEALVGKVGSDAPPAVAPNPGAAAGPK
jgi:D-alanyl-D-alanine carboxypeptidase/D-alanyl-D-alanine-endopeptidase (penicillin-binding protein 4)